MLKNLSFSLTRGIACLCLMAAGTISNYSQAVEQTVSLAGRWRF